MPPPSSPAHWSPLLSWLESSASSLGGESTGCISLRSQTVRGSKNNSTFIYSWVLLFQINYRDVYEAGLLTTQIQVFHSTYSLEETVIAMLNIIYSVVPFN